MLQLTSDSRFSIVARYQQPLTMCPISVEALVKHPTFIHHRICTLN